MIVAVIPARGGSKRIPRKNIRDFAGKPIIAWPIEAALKSGLFDEVIVSTDDTEIADIAKAAGALVPFMRPAALADDHAGTTAVMSHAIEHYRASGQPLEAACCIYATAPTVAAEDLREGLDRLLNGSWSFVFSATDFAAPIYRAFTLESSGSARMLWPEHFISRSQDLPTALHDAAQFYWGTAEAWTSAAPIFGPTGHPMHIARWKVQDIDTPDDWIRAEAIFRAMQSQRNVEGSRA